MSEDIQAEMRAIIEKNLPAEVGKTLQNQLQLLEAFKAENKQQKEKIEVLEKRLIEKGDRLISAESALKMAGNLEEKAFKLAEGERNLAHRLEIAALQTTNALNIKNEIKEIVSLVFCSLVSKKLVTENSSYNKNGTQANGAYLSENGNNSKTITEDSTGPNLQG
jgi:uncharacterized protein YxjI